MCHRHSFLLTRAGKVLDGRGLTDSHTEIREMHGLKNTDDSVNAYEWQPPKGWPETDWHLGLTKDNEVFTTKASHDAAMERHVKTLYPTMAAWHDGDKATITEAELIEARQLIADSEWLTVPEVTLPNGSVVPSFQVAKYPAARGTNAVPVSLAAERPWVDINYHQVRAITARVGLALLRESQALAIAWDICQQDINWTGGRVGEGQLYQGIRQGRVSKAQAGNYGSPDPDERSWHQLSNGERIYHFAGNVYGWIFDDIQGDENGIVARRFAEDSPSIATAPCPSREKGMGWRPRAGDDWSGGALIRGGCWDSGARAGAFNLGRGWPDHRYGGVGFRCTQPIGL